MSGFGILMIIFSSAILLVGIYMFSGHKIGILEGRVAFKNLTIDEWKKIGKYTIIVSIFVFMLGLIGLVFHFE
ncbi:MAG: hypothetical protein IKF82_06115 [Bacilli bacterium]|nr:hypothetical protein [Bacilli bacterium]MBR3209823.1 hypothetical protein [Bacilli bacterium]